MAVRRRGQIACHAPGVTGGAGRPGDRGERTEGAKADSRFFLMDAPSEEVLRSIVEQSRARSAVYDIVTNGVPVVIALDAAS